MTSRGDKNNLEPLVTALDTTLQTAPTDNLLLPTPANSSNNVNAGYARSRIISLIADASSRPQNPFGRQVSPQHCRHPRTMLNPTATSPITCQP